jgi:hypothetical protein
MSSFGFTANELEPLLYYCKRGDKFVVIWLHVNDSFAVGSSKHVLNDLHQAMSKEVEVKWSDSVKKLVGINIKNVDKHTRLDQAFLIDQIINNYLRTCYPCRSTLPEEPLVINTRESVNPTDYRSTLGSLMYLCRSLAQTYCTPLTYWQGTVQTFWQNIGRL